MRKSTPKKQTPLGFNLGRMLDIEAGDVLVFTLKEYMSGQQAARITSQLRGMVSTVGFVELCKGKK